MAVESPCMSLPVSCSISDLISLKRDGKELTEAQIETIIKTVSDGSMEDCQLGAFLMSVFIRGMTIKEVVSLTKSMKNSGTMFQWPESWKVVDKHSTGGVGDKVSLPLAPALATLGLKVPMISGRGLGHTGGTLDKLESIPGFRVSLSEHEMMECLKDVGCCIVGQTGSLVPADGRMYALRDVTATVMSHPLIVSSVVSKKAAEGLHSLVLDVKFGSGSIVGSQSEALTMADTLVAVGEGLGIHTTALVTSMESPIGRCIGNSLEVAEALECLRGKGPKDLRMLVSHLGGELLFNTKTANSVEEGIKMIEESLDDGSAMKKFCQMIQFQGVSKGEAEAVCGSSESSNIPKASKITTIKASAAGRITLIHTLKMAEVSLDLGGGRKNTSDVINYAVGVVLLKVVGDIVAEEEPCMEIHHDGPLEASILKKAQEAICIEAAEENWSSPCLIVKRVSRTQ